MENKIYLLIKIFEDEAHANSFLENGEMFCQTLRAFKAIEDGNVRGDKDEGLTHYFKPSGLTMTFSYTDDTGTPTTHTMTDKDFAGPLVIRTTAFDSHNIFCMYAISFDNFEVTYTTEDEKIALMQKINSDIREQIKIADDASKLGAHAVVIYKVGEFINKIRSYANDNNIDFYYRRVEYIDFDENTHSGKFGNSQNGIEAIFQKKHIYSSQKEFRFAFDINDGGNSEIMRIESLKDIAVKTTLQEVASHLTIKILDK